MSFIDILVNAHQKGLFRGHFTQPRPHYFIEKFEVWKYTEGRSLPQLCASCISQTAAEAAMRLFNQQ
jgi:ArsR family metal-binding transcriptional regulator